MTAARERVTAKVRAYLESIQRPGVDYDTIRADIERLIEEPGVGVDALAERVKAVLPTLELLLGGEPGKTGEEGGGEQG